MKRAITLVTALLPLCLAACGSAPFQDSNSLASPSKDATHTAVRFQAPHLTFKEGTPPVGFNKFIHGGDRLLKGPGEITVKPSGGVWRLLVSVACSAPTTISISAIQSGFPAPVPVLRQAQCSLEPSYLGEAVLQGSNDPITVRVNVPAGQEVWVSSYMRL